MTTLGNLPWDKEDKRNIGVLADELVGPSNGFMMRRISLMAFGLARPRAMTRRLDSFISAALLIRFNVCATPAPYKAWERCKGKLSVWLGDRTRVDDNSEAVG